MPFSPSLQNAASAGIPVTTAPYAEGNTGIRQSLDAMALKMREGRVDPSVVGWARQSLKDAGIDGRDGFPIRQWGGVLLSTLRKQAIYAPDAYGAEVVSSAAATLCLRPGLCINGGDCDDLAVALGSALLSLGIPVAIVKQNFGGENQQHVLIAFQDETGDWIYADPSTNAALGTAPKAVDEIWVDPMGAVGPLPEATAQIVTFGAPMQDRMVYVGRAWWHQGVGGVSVFEENQWLKTELKSIPSPVGVGTIFGSPTVNEMIDFAAAVGYAMTQLGDAALACKGWADMAAFTTWQSDLLAAQTDFQAASTAADTKFKGTLKYLRDFTTAPEEWAMLTDVMAQINDLDRRLRAPGGCAAPTYPDMPQPIANDWDLQGYQGADVVVKAVEKAENAVKQAAQPINIALGGVIVGVVLAVGGIILIDRMLPAHR